MALTIQSVHSCVSWTDYQQHMLSTYQRIYESHQYSDCRLILADGELRANRAILGMASAFFETIFSAAKNQPIGDPDTPMVLIPDVPHATMSHILQFIHTGEVRLQSHDMALFVEGCSLLQIRGIRCERDRIVGINFTGSCLKSDRLKRILDNGTEVGSITYVLDDDGQENAMEQSPDGTEDENRPCTPEHRLEQTESDDYYNLLEEMLVGEGIDLSPRPTDDFISKTSSTRVDKRQDPTAYYERLNQAMNAVLNEGVSYGMASLRYNMSKSVLWRRTTKILNADEPVIPHADTILNQEGADNLDTYRTTGVFVKPEPESEPVPGYAKRLDAAIDAVLKQGCTYRAASLKYNIPKTVLWRKTIKRPRLAVPPKIPTTRLQAIDAMKSGEKLLNVSRRFKIPITTLHRDKLRLYNSGTLPSEVSLKQRDKGEQYDRRLAEASQECIAGRMSLLVAARTYGLPKTSIWRKVNKSGKGDRTGEKPDFVES